VTEDIPNPEAWNKSEILDRIGGDEELLQELIGIFVEGSPIQMLKLKNAVSSADAEGVMQAAHSIKGELMCLGGNAAAKTAQELETMGRDEKLSGASEAFATLEREVASVTVLLKDSIAVHP
jgi:HPt (histidine-containing phosphotransfer) domain-containing protein